MTTESAQISTIDWLKMSIAQRVEPSRDVVSAVTVREAAKLGRRRVPIG